MSSEMAKYLCAITLPVQAAIAIREIQESYKSSSWQIPMEPHLTLVPPGAVLAHLEQTETMIRAAIAGTLPFDITVCGIGTFENGSHTIYAKVEPSEELTALQYALYCASVGFMAKPNVRSEHFGNHFLPHIVLSSKLNATIAQQIVTQLEGQHIDFTFRCESIGLFIKSPTDTLWSESKRLHF